MKIRIHRVRNRKKRELLRDATKLFLRELLPQHVRSPLEINITMKPWLAAFGSCEPWAIPGSRPRRFEIELHPHQSNVRRLLKTLGHECMHVKQFAMGELSEPARGITIWHKRRFVDKEIHYDDHPWEIEASLNEENLWVLWKQRHLA